MTTDIKQEFKVYCSTNFNELNKSLIQSNFQENNGLILEGIASTTSIDEDGDYMTESCIEDMKKQAIGLNVLKEHGRGLKDVIGTVVGVPESTKDVFKIQFKILPQFENYILTLLENDISLGLSIGAKAIEYEETDDPNTYGWKVNKNKLYEISLVPLPANWDSFGSVKISKEIDNNQIIAKCFNGACKQITKKYNKELEDAQKDEEETYLTKKECLNLINEASISIYERLLSEIIDETKKMIEKYHLTQNISENNTNNTNTNNTDDDSENQKNDESNKIDENSSNNKEDEEKEKSMTTQEIEKNVTEEKAPDVQEELEEVKGTSTEEQEEKKEPQEEETTEEKEVSNKDVLKSINEMKSFLNKNFDEEIDKRLNAKIDEMKKSIRKEVEADLFKELTTERKPVETEQPTIEEETAEEEMEEVKKTMSTHDIAKMLCN